jgi:D-alanyl-D-alanine carboxypeptidase/D-alanyl-D-alanine-endopeptidase (penicillin-binding protein 4)
MNAAARWMAAALCWVAGLGAPAQTAVPVSPTGTDTPLGAQIAALLADPAVSRAHWGIAVTTLDGKPVYGLDEDKLFRPASTAKLFTTAAALALLGPERRFTTTVTTDGRMDGPTLHGNLVLRGGGDANFAGRYVLPFVANGDDGKTKPVEQALADIDDLAAQIAAKGITAVDGTVLGDDTFFEYTPYPEGWPADDLLWGYGAPVSALTVHENVIDLSVKAAAKSGDPAELTLVPSLGYYTVNKPVAGEGWTPDVYTLDMGADQVGIERAPGSRDLRIFGDVAAKYPPVHQELAIEDPAEYAALALKDALARHGVRVQGKPRARHADTGFVGSFLAETTAAQPAVARFDPASPVSCNASAVKPGPQRQTLATHESLPLQQDVGLTLKTSQNLHAELMLRDIAALDTCEPTLRRSVQWVRQFLVNAGVSAGEFVFYDGSGLSTKDLVTPRAEAQLLAFAVKQPWFAAWKAALPAGGVDGTLEHRFTDVPLKGHVFAKTGTMGESRALAGYMDCASGRQVIFSILVDDHTPGSSADRAVMDKIVAAIAANE